MSTRTDSLSNVEAEAKKVLGERAANWLHRPHRSLDGMTPHELAQSPAGAWVVLRQLERDPLPIIRGSKPRGTRPRRTA
jgi:uncharacterized protein (DUF2384 family)